MNNKRKNYMRPKDHGPPPLPTIRFKVTYLENGQNKVAYVDTSDAGQARIVVKRGKNIPESAIVSIEQC